MILRFLRFLAVCAALTLAQFAFSASAFALCGTGTGTCYGVATGNWSSSATWSITSGGAGGAGPPATGDAIVFDTNSNGKTFTQNANYSVSALTSTCTCTWYIDSPDTITVTGNTFSLGAGLTLTGNAPANSTWTFTSTSGPTTITTNGVPVPALTFNGVGGDFVISGNLVEFNNNQTVTLTNGTLDFSVSNGNYTGGGISSSNSNTRVLNCGTGTFTINAAAPINFGTSTGLTTSCASATFDIKAPSGSGRNISTGGQSFGPFTIEGLAACCQGGSLVQVIMNNSGATFASLTLTGYMFVQVPNGGTFTLSTAPTWNAPTPGAIQLQNSNNTSSSYLTFAVSSGAPSLNGVALEGIKFTGTTGTATNSVDNGYNVGITITGPSGFGGGSHVIGG